MLEVNRKSTIVTLLLRNENNTGWPVIGNNSDDYEILSTIRNIDVGARLMFLRVYADNLIIASSRPDDYNLRAVIRSEGVIFSLIDDTPDPVTSVSVPICGSHMFIEAEQPEE